MIEGVRGRLISASFIRDLLPAFVGPEAPPPGFLREIERWSERCESALGPASSVRSIADVLAVPLLGLLGLRVTTRQDHPELCLLHTAWAHRTGPDLLVAPWQEPLSRVWRQGVLAAIGTDNRWALCTNGSVLRIVDAQRTWSRDYLEFDLTRIALRDDPVTLLWRLARGESITAASPLLDRAVAASAAYGQDVCRALGAGALEALALLVAAIGPGASGAARTSRKKEAEVPEAAFHHAVTVLYRVLFLLFAEARGLVPTWHPIYRDRYSFETIVTELLTRGRVRGLWQAIQAISRLAHDGCTAGELTVNAFNGRLFSAADTARLERRRIHDEPMSRAIAAVAIRGRGPSRERMRILYRDLDVEQLGAVYEQVIEHEPSRSAGRLERSRERRKATGTFYTPRAVTSFLVRRTLEPLARGRTAADILRLRILDPAMGSGAVLVAACRYLAAAAEEALVRDGEWHAADVTPPDRASLRREVALRCLYGVDVNPTAVQLARLSLWLTTLAADKPLSFLDHHLVAGDSLIGARLEDVQRRPGRVAGRHARAADLPLFDGDALEEALQHAIDVRTRLARQPDESAAIVREKERLLASLTGGEAPLVRWSALLDLWCATWFWNEEGAPDRRTFAALSDRVVHGRSDLPPAAATALLERAAAVAAERRFLHWPLAFPEVFAGPGGRSGLDSGFDAIIGNPPWDIVRGDSGSDDERAGRAAEARQLTAFVRESGVYRVGARAHVNRYQLFVERAMQLARPGGRIGLVLPSGIASDAGSAPLRRHLFDRTDVDSITGLDNRAGIFPIHRSVRFVLLTCTVGRPTSGIACRFHVPEPGDLDGAEPRDWLRIGRPLLARLSGEDDLGLPQLGSELDLRILERITARIPRLAHADGWQAQFGRELNATDDRHRFVRRTGRPGTRPVLEGKQIDRFRISLDGCRFEVPAGSPLPAAVPSRPRLAYRDVASATNRMTLIAAIVPAAAVTTHTLFCLKSALDLDAQRVLCALLNSFVANYLIRMRVSTHVTVTLVSRLPVPFLRRGDGAFERLARAATTIERTAGDVEGMAEYAELQALAARLYGLSAHEFGHVLDTFPLVGAACRSDALARFSDES